MVLLTIFGLFLNLIGAAHPGLNQQDETPVFSSQKIVQEGVVDALNDGLVVKKNVDHPEKIEKSWQNEVIFIQKVFLPRYCVFETSSILNQSSSFCPRMLCPNLYSGASAEKAEEENFTVRHAHTRLEETLKMALIWLPKFPYWPPLG